MFDAYFWGLWITVIFLGIAVEYYFLALDKYTEDEIGKTQFILLSSAAAVSFLIHIRNIKISHVSVLPLLLLPAIYSIMRIIEALHEKQVENCRMEKDIASCLEAIKKRPDISAPYIMLGDIYARQENYEKALQCYERGNTAESTPESLQKIKLASRGLRIKRGEIWVCKECRQDNPCSAEKCRECGASKNTVKYLKDDFRQNKADIKRWVIMGFSIPIVLILALGLLKMMLSSAGYAILAALISISLVMVILKKFFSW